jgi:hypothetical protein
MTDQEAEDLRFAEQVADIEFGEAANRLLAALGKPAMQFGPLDVGSRRRIACYAILRRATHPDILRRALAEFDNGDSDNNDILCAIARHPATPADVLVTLAWNKYLMVGQRASSDPRLPAAEIERLARDGRLPQLWGILINPATPPRILADLAGDGITPVGTWDSLAEAARRRVARRS